MKRLLLLFVCLGMVFSSMCFAEIIVLKSGKEIVGKIIDRDDEKITVDLFIDTPVTYYLEEIENIGEETLNSSPTTEETKQHRIISYPIRYRTMIDLQTFLRESAEYLMERAKAVSENLTNPDLETLLQSNNDLFPVMERDSVIVTTINMETENGHKKNQKDQKKALLSLLQYVLETQDLLESVITRTDQAIATSKDTFVMHYLDKNKLYCSRYKKVLSKIENDLKTNIEILNS